MCQGTSVRRASTGTTKNASQAIICDAVAIDLDPSSYSTTRQSSGYFADVVLIEGGEDIARQDLMVQAIPCRTKRVACCNTLHCVTDHPSG